MIESSRYEQGNADALLWQTGYRVLLALLAGAAAVLFRSAGILSLSSIAESVVRGDGADWMLGLVSIAYVALVLAIRWRVQTTRSAGPAIATLVVIADVVVVFCLVFLFALPEDYDRALLIALFSLQLTHMYFGRTPALLLIVAIASGYLLLNDLAIRYNAPVTWSETFVTLGIFGVGAMLVILVQSSLHTRLAALVTMFERAEEGDFVGTYDVAADRRPDALTAVGRAYNRMRTQLASIVLTDPLSGCLNRRGFEQQYRRELSRSARAHTDLALLAIDLDYFKRVNDTFGHLVGDRVIAEAGELLRANARAGDLVARTGGEEFTILAPDTGADGAVHLASRINDAFRRKQFAEPRSRKVLVTVSIGVVADTVPSEEMAEDLRARADEALYAAKRSGRNRHVVWSVDLEAMRMGQSGEGPAFGSGTGASIRSGVGPSSNTPLAGPATSGASGRLR